MGFLAGLGLLRATEAMGIPVFAGGPWSIPFELTDVTVSLDSRTSHETLKWQLEVAKATLARVRTHNTAEITARTRIHGLNSSVEFQGVPAELSSPGVASGEVSFPDQLRQMLARTLLHSAPTRRDILLVFWAGAVTADLAELVSLNPLRPAGSSGASLVVIVQLADFSDASLDAVAGRMSNPNATAVHPLAWFTVQPAASLPVDFVASYVPRVFAVDSDEFDPLVWIPGQEDPASPPACTDASRPSAVRLLSVWPGSSAWGRSLGPWCKFPPSEADRSPVRGFSAASVAQTHVSELATDSGVRGRGIGFVTHASFQCEIPRTFDWLASPTVGVVLEEESLALSASVVGTLQLVSGACSPDTRASSALAITYDVDQENARVVSDPDGKAMAGGGPVGVLYPRIASAERGAAALWTGLSLLILSL